MQYIERPQDMLLSAFLLVNSSIGNVFHGNCPTSSRKPIGQVPCQQHFNNFKRSLRNEPYIVWVQLCHQLAKILTVYFLKKSEMAATAADSSYQSPLGEEAVVPVKTPLGKMPYILTNFHKTIFILNLVCPDWIKYCPTILNLNLNFHKTLVIMVNQRVILVLCHKQHLLLIVLLKIHRFR